MTLPRVVSLLPSATEIVCALGRGDCLVGVTHECDWPPKVQGIPPVTASSIDSAGLSAGEIDQAVRESLAEQASIYHLDTQLLARLEPDIVLTQELCDVCAVGPDEVKAAVATLRKTPDVVSLEPRTLDDVIETILRVGVLVDAEQRARDLIADLRRRLDAVASAVRGQPARRVLSLEWIDPVFVGGHWVPEMVALAGGEDVLGAPGAPSREATWAEVESSCIDVVVAMLCGFDLNRSLVEMQRAAWPEAWHKLPAVRAGHVHVVDGSAYFSRPGPRLVTGVEILASILHPDVCPRTEGAGVAAPLISHAL